MGVREDDGTVYKIMRLISIRTSLDLMYIEWTLYRNILPLHTFVLAHCLQEIKCL
jgi:hypothetical protein